MLALIGLSGTANAVFPGLRLWIGGLALLMRPLCRYTQCACRSHIEEGVEINA